MNKRIKQYSITYRKVTWYFAEVQVRVFWWWVTLCTIKDLNEWYPAARAQEILDSIEDEIGEEEE